MSGDAKRQRKQKSGDRGEWREKWKYGRPTSSLMHTGTTERDETKQERNEKINPHCCIAFVPCMHACVCSTEYMTMTIQKTFASLLWSRSLFYDRLCACTSGMYVPLTLCTYRFHSFYSIQFSRLKREIFFFFNNLPLLFNVLYKKYSWSSVFHFTKKTQRYKNWRRKIYETCLISTWNNIYPVLVFIFILREKKKYRA